MLSAHSLVGSWEASLHERGDAWRGQCMASGAGTWVCVLELRTLFGIFDAIVRVPVEMVRD